MKVLIACEFSGRVREAFAKRGHDAWSCDLLPTEIPGKHIQENIKDVFSLYFWTNWDLCIAFPPCTDLACSGAAWFDKKRKDGRQKKSIDFFMLFTMVNIPKIAIENPIGIMSTIYRKPDQIIQPWQFGEPYQKSTCLWLKNLPKLTPTKIVDKGEFITYKSGKKMSKWYASLRGRGHERSRTFQGIADAMAEQWG